MTSIKLTVEHIKYATNTQLSNLLKKDPSTTCHWLKRNFNLGSLEIHYSCIDIETLATGLIQRQSESKKIKALQAEFDEILKSSEELQDRVVA